MVYELHDTSKVERLFEGWNETPIYSCIQKIMGKIYVVNPENPISAFAFVGCFGFYAGKPDIELIKNKPAGFVIMVPQNRNWAELIERVYPDARKVTRYAIRKDTIFDSDALKNNLQLLPDGYELRNIDGRIYEKCLENPVTADFVSAFGMALIPLMWSCCWSSAIPVTRLRICSQTTACCMKRSVLSRANRNTACLKHSEQRQR